MARQENTLHGYITRDQLAKELGKSIRTISRWEARRIGPAPIVIGRLILYNVETVKEWLNSHQLKRVG